MIALILLIIAGVTIAVCGSSIIVKTFSLILALVTFLFSMALMLLTFVFIFTMFLITLIGAIISTLFSFLIL